MDSFHPGGHYPLLDQTLYHDSGFLDGGPSNLDQPMSPRGNRNAITQQSSDLPGNDAHKSSTGDTSLDAIEKLLQQVFHSLLELLERQKREQEENKRTQEGINRKLEVMNRTLEVMNRTQEGMNRTLDPMRTKRPAQRAPRSHIPQYNEPVISESSLEGMVKELIRTHRPQQFEPQYPSW